MLTFFDVVEHLIIASFGGPQDAEQRDIRSAVHRAYQELTTMRDWSSYSTHGRIVTQEPYSTGTVAYSASTNTLTLTGGTWPAWAAYGYVRVANRVAKIASVTSSTAAVLDTQLTFPEDFGASPYVLYRTVYPLPSDLRNMDEPSNEFFWWTGLYLTPDEAMKVERVNYRSGYPLHWTIIKNPESDGWALKLIGYPTKEETIDFTYRRRARPIKYSGHEAAARAGTISANFTLVTGSGTSFASDMLGSVLRVGGASHPDTLAGLSPYVAESVIVSVNSSISVNTRESVLASTAKYLVTCPIDLPPHMHNAMMSCAEYWLARIRNQKPDNAFALYQRDLRLAMEQETLAPISGRTTPVYSDRGWRSPLTPDGGT